MAQGETVSEDARRTLVGLLGLVGAGAVLAAMLFLGFYLTLGHP